MCFRKYSKKARLKAVMDYVEQVRIEAKCKEDKENEDTLNEEIVSELLTIENGIRKECQ